MSEDFRMVDCPFYHDPRTNCTQTLFDVMPLQCHLYAALALFCSTGLFTLFFLEAFSDYRSSYTPWKKLIIYPKIMMVIYSLLKSTAVVLFVVGLAGNTTGQATIESLVQALALGVSAACYLLCVIHWFSMLLTAEQFGVEPKEIKAVRWILTALVVLILPLLILLYVLGIYKLGGDAFIMTSRIFLVSLLIFSYTVIVIYIGKTYWWFHRDRELMKRYERFQTLRKKTGIITANTIWSMLTTTLVLYINSWPAALPESIIYQKIALLGHEATNALLMWWFGEGHLKAGYCGSPEEPEESADD